MTETLRITGMTCAHCTRTIENAVEELPGIQTVRVSLQMKELTYTGETPRADVIAAIQDAGYDVEGE